GKFTLYYIGDVSTLTITLVAYFSSYDVAEKASHLPRTHAKIIKEDLLKNPRLTELLVRLGLQPVSLAEGSLLHIITHEPSFMGLFDSLVFRPLDVTSYSLTDAAQVIAKNFENILFGTGKWRFDERWKQLI